ncbi:MAG: glycosyl hydrolase [Glaciimonas sp.]|nr:glycosyl hydrolase [Glaciimonas sp.]
MANAEPDVLDRPAVMSKRAANAVMLTVTRAAARLVAGGERGIIVYSDDGGKAWTQAKVPVSVSITNLNFPNARLGWAVGHSGIVLHSTDAGATWVKQLDGHQAAALVLSATKQAAGDSDESRRALADAERLVADGSDKPFFDVHFFDANNGLVVGAYGLILATADGGKTWSSQHLRIPNPKGKHLYSISTVGKDVYIAGEQGALFHSSDGTAQFEEINTPYAGTFFGVLTGGEQRLNVFGLRGNAYWTVDGKNWQKSETGASNTLAAGTRLKDGSLALVDEAGRVMISRDGGASFRQVPIAKPSPLTGITQVADGGLVVSGVRGLTRIAAIDQGGQTK